MKGSHRDRAYADDIVLCESAQVCTTDAMRYTAAERSFNKNDEDF